MGSAGRSGGGGGHRSLFYASKCINCQYTRCAGACPDACRATDPFLQPATREYALSRALQLDPKCVPAWVTLARLYAGEGPEGQQQHCQACTEHEPLTWLSIMGLQC